MPICRKLKEFLDGRKVRYVVIAHSRAYTAPEVAASAHVKGKNLVKCVIVNADGKQYLVAASANQKVNLQKIKHLLNANEVRLAQESEFAPLFGDCETGAMPPFGNLYGVPVIADGSLYAAEEIAFSGGNHTTVVKMAFADFERLVQPLRGDVAD